MRKIILLVIILVVVSLGCTIPGPGGKETGSYQSNDILVIKNIKVSPQSNIFPGTNISITGILENTEKETINDVSLSLYDDCGFELISSNIRRKRWTTRKKKI